MNNQIKAQLFGLFLFKNRKAQNLSLENVGKAINKTPAQVRLIEKGVITLSPEDMNTAAQLLGFPAFKDNMNLQPYFDHLLEKFDDLFFHQDQEEINKLLCQIDTQKKKWEFSTMFFLNILFSLIPYRYSDPDSSYYLALETMDEYLKYMTPFELFFYHSLQGVIAYQSHQIALALKHFEKAVAYDQNRIGLYIQLAIVYQTLEYRQKCLLCINRASYLLLKSPDVYRMLQLSLLYTNLRKEKSISYKEAISERLCLYNECIKGNIISLATATLSNISYMYLCNEDYMNGLVYAKKSLELDHHPASNCHWFIPYCYWKMGATEEGKQWITSYQDSPSPSSYVSSMCTAIRHFIDHEIREGIDVLEKVHQYLLASQEMDCLLFLLDWLIEMYSGINDMEKMYLCEKEVRGIYQRRTET